MYGVLTIPVEEPVIVGAVGAPAAYTCVGDMIGVRGTITYEKRSTIDSTFFATVFPVKILKYSI